jgi:hypothetical protein
LAWDIPESLDSLKQEFLSLLSEDVSPEIILDTEEAKRVWLSLRLASDTLRLKYMSSPIYLPGLVLGKENGFLYATDGLVETAIPSGGIVFELNFSYGDATPALITSVPIGGMITQVDLILLTPFDGVGAVISVGTELVLDNLMSISQNDLSVASTYITKPGLVCSSLTGVYLHMVQGAGASAGNGVILVSVNN